MKDFSHKKLNLFLNIKQLKDIRKADIKRSSLIKIIIKNGINIKCAPDDIGRNSVIL